MIRKFIPNFITLLNLFCGSIAVILAVQNQLVFASIFVGLGIFFDFFDGFFARLLNVPSKIGLQLDSLADVVTSGLVPGIVMTQLFIKSLGGPTEVLIFDWESAPNFHFSFPLFALFGLLIALASAYRLAKFNVDTRQTSSFIGLPTPANAILIFSLPLILAYQSSEVLSDLILNPWFLGALTIFSCVLLNLELPMFGLKFKSWDFKSNWYRYIFIIFSVAALLSLQFVALPIIILVYLLFSFGLYYWEES